MSRNTISNIIFDMGGVLVDLNPQRSIEAYEILGAHRTAAYVKEFRTEDMFLAIEVGDMTMAEFCQEVRRIDGITASDEDILEAWNILLEPSDNIRREALVRLREGGYRLFLLSNTCLLHWQTASTILIPATGKDINYYFERCFVSYEMRCRKPSKDIYLQVVEQTGISAGATVFVDDSEGNVEAASELGFHTFHEREDHRWVDHLMSQLL